MTEASSRELAVGFGLASIVFGATFGVVATAQGHSLLIVLLMSVLVFGGGAQFGALGVVAAGGSPVAAVGVGLALNSRFLLMGLPVAARLPAGFLRRAVLSLLSIDGSLLAAMVETNPHRVERAFRDMGLLIFGLWQLGTVVGVLAGGWLADPELFGVDALIPAVFIGLVAPLIDGPEARWSAIWGALACLLLIPIAPPGMPVIGGALFGVAAGLIVGVRRQKPTPC